MIASGVLSPRSSEMEPSLKDSVPDVTAMTVRKENRQRALLSDVRRDLPTAR
jgi:hypothetical protein